MFKSAYKLLHSCVPKERGYHPFLYQSSKLHLSISFLHFQKVEEVYLYKRRYHIKIRQRLSLASSSPQRDTIAIRVHFLLVHKIHDRAVPSFWTEFL